MDAIIIIGVLIAGWTGGYVCNSLLSTNRHREEVAEAFENGKEFERMRISKAIDEKFGSGSEHTSDGA